MKKVNGSQIESKLKYHFRSWKKANFALKKALVVAIPYTEYVRCSGEVERHSRKIVEILAFIEQNYLHLGFERYERLRTFSCFVSGKITGIQSLPEIHGQEFIEADHARDWILDKKKR